MNISEEISFDKDGQVERFPNVRTFFLTLVIILVAILSFGLGSLSGVGEKEPIKIEYDSAISNQASVSNAIHNIENSTSVTASKSGSKYHYAYCPGAKQIKETNKITFTSPQAAEASGYTLAGNCEPR